MDAEREYIAKGHRLRYWLPKLMLPIAATVMFVIGLILHQAIDKTVLMAALAVVFSWLLVVFRPFFVKAMMWKYNEDYAKFDTKVSAIIISVLAIGLSAVLIFM